MSKAVPTAEERDDADSYGPVQAGQDALAPLRWWPAAAIVLLMVGLRMLVTLFDTPPIIVMMLSFMGPGLLALAVPLWWLFASRGARRERWAGGICFLAVAILSIACSHPSMLGMGTVLFQLPVGSALFALALVLLAGAKSVRLPAAIVAAVIGFGFWDSVQLFGTDGSFKPEFGWRWTPSAEQKYLAELAKQSKPASAAQSNNTSPGDGTLRANADWPDFRGSGRGGIVRNVELKTDWQANPPKVIWKRRVGPGWSSFSAANNRLFTQEQRGEDEAVVCLDAQTGNELWAYVYLGRFYETIGGAGPRATPTIGDNVVFTQGANGRVACLDASTGKEIWHRELSDEADRKPPTWGWSSSPLLINGRVVVHAGGADGNGLLAFDAATGKRVWSAASGNHTYSSPQLATLQGVEGILMMCNQGLRFHSIDDGKALWFHEWKSPNYRAIQPLVLGDSILIGTSLGQGTRKIAVHNEDSKWNIEIDWTSSRLKPDYNDFVAYDGAVYGFDANIFACIDFETGKRHWKRGRYGNGQVLLLESAGQLLLVSEEGELVLLKASPDSLNELAKVQAIEGKTWNHAIVVGDRVFLRNGQEAACWKLPLAR